MSFNSLVLADSPIINLRHEDVSGTTSNDSSGNANDGTYVGTPTLNQRSLLFLPYQGKSAVMGVGKRVTIPAGLITTDTYTYEFLIKPTSVTGAQCLAHDGTNGIYLNGDKLSLYYSATHHDSTDAVVINEVSLLQVVVTAGAVEYFINRVSAGTAASAPTFSATTLYAEDGAGAEIAASVCEFAAYTTAVLASKIRLRYYDAFAVGFRKVLANLTLSGHWPLAEIGAETTAFDVSGNANDGTFSNVVLDKTNMVHQQQGRSVLFNGVTSDVAIIDTAAIQNIFDGGGCAGALLNASSDGEGAAGRVLDKNVWHIAVVGQVGGLAKIKFTQLFDTTDGVWQSTAFDLTLGADGCVLVNYDNSNVANDPVIYIDGLSVALTETSTPVGTRTTDVGSDLHIGNNAAGSSTFAGRLSNAFTADAIVAYQALQINESMRSRAAAEIISHDPTGYWRGNEPSGSNLIDYGSEGNNGTLSNATFGNAATPLSNELQTSIDFDGAGDFVSIPHVAAYNQNEQTLIFNSVAPITKPAVDSKGLVYKAATTGFVQDFNSRYSKTLAEGLSMGGTTASASYKIITADDSIFGQGWSFSALVKTQNAANDDLLGYLDGVLIDQLTTSTGHLTQGSNAIEFGRIASNSNSGRYYDGQMAEVALFSLALSAAVVLDIFEMLSYSPISFGVTGSITESLSATDFFVRASQLDTGAVIGEAVMQGDNTYSLDFGLIPGYEAYVDEVLITALPKTGKRRLNSMAYSIGDYYIPADVTTNDHIYKVTVAGTTAASEPTLDIIGGTTVDGTVTVQDMGVTPTPQTQIDYAFNF
ncbi:MAG: hypothetical protein COB22_07890 [Cycloclasticus sp.]|nr:MAG: hypothetical protein COB22_07890 [Cycloclasticus sp.]